MVASVRRAVRIARPADDVWALVGDFGALAEWFPGVVDAKVTTTDGVTTRAVTTASGLTITEQIVFDDPLQRRFQYTALLPILHHHLATVDVFDLGDGTSLVAHATDADPDAMALIIGGAAGAGLHRLKALLEGDGRTSR